MGAPPTKLTRSLFDNRVGRRMLILFMICALAPVLLGGLLSFAITETQLERQTHDNLRRATKAAGLWLYDRLLAVEDSIALVAGAAASGDGRQPLRSAGSGLTSRLLALSLLDASGAGQALLGPLIPRPYLDARQTAHLRDGRTVLQVGAGPGGRAQVLLLRQVDDGAQAGLLVAEPHPDFLWRMNEDSDTRFCITDSSGSFLHCPYPPAAELLGALHEARSQSMSGHLDHSEDSSGLHNHYWTLFLGGHFAADSWVVIAQHHTLSGGAAARKLFLTAFPAVLLLTVLLALLVSLVQIRRFTQPLNRLMAATRMIALGRLETRVDVNSGDEFETLGDSFNTMTDSLNETFSTLEGFSEIDRTILSASSPSDVLDAVAANVPELLRCERAAIISLSGRGSDGEVRICARDMPYARGQVPLSLDATSHAQTIERTASEVLCSASGDGATGEKAESREQRAESRAADRHCAFGCTNPRNTVIHRMRRSNSNDQFRM